MSLQFIKGPVGSGKSHFIYDKFVKDSETYPDKKFFLIVPEQYNMQAQRDFIQSSPRKGMLNVEVLSFNRLAHRVLAEVGTAQTIVLDDIGKSMILRKVIKKHLPELRTFGAHLQKAGYLDELKSILSEFTQYRVTDEQLAKLIAEQEPNSNLALKLQDLRVIYKGFHEYMEGKYITGEELPDVMCDVMSQSEILKNSVVALDGFTGFTPIQVHVIEKMMCICEDVFVTVTRTKKGSSRLYTLSDQTISDLEQSAKSCGVQMKERVCFPDNHTYRFQNNDALAFLSENLFAYTKAIYDKDQSQIEIGVAQTPKEEVQCVAENIRRLIRTKDYRFKDIAVIAGDLNVYSNYIEEVFEKYHLPVFADSKRSILMNSFVEYVRALLEMVEKNFSYESVLRYLRTGMTDFKDEEIDSIENYIRAVGVRTYKKWSEPWSRTTKLIGEQQVAHLEKLRQKFIQHIGELTTVLKQRHKTVLEITTALHDFFVNNQVQQKIKDYEVYFENEGQTVLAREYAQVYRILMELFDKFVELLGDESLSLKEYCELLDAGLEQAKVGSLPPTLDQIVVGDIERTRVSDIKAVFFVGVNDSYIPGSAGAGGFLSNYDREKLCKGERILAPTEKEKTYIQQYYLYLTVTKPSEYLHLSYCTSSGGDAMRPAYLIGNIQKMFPMLKTQSMKKTFRDSEITSESGITYLIRGLWSKREGFSDEWKEVYNWYKSRPEWENKIGQILEASFYVKPKDALTKEIARELYGKVLENSISRLEKFAECAYKHFLQYGIGLKEREESQFQKIDFGNIFHKALELFSKQMEAEGYAWSTLTDEKEQELIQSSIDACLEEDQNAILQDTARDGYMIQHIHRMMKRTIWAQRFQMSKGDFVSAGCEVKVEKELELSDEAKMLLTGVVDRIDICEEDDKLYVKIIDYKTGHKQFDISLFYHGLQLQLLTYMAVTMERLQGEFPKKEVLPAGCLYYEVKDPIIDEHNGNQEEKILSELRPRGVLTGDMEAMYHFDKITSGNSLVIPLQLNKDGSLNGKCKLTNPKVFQKMTEYALETILENGEKIASGNIDVNPHHYGKKTGCEYCPYQSICRFDERLDGCDYRELNKLTEEEIDQLWQ